MTRKSLIQRNFKRMSLVNKFKNIRLQLKQKINNRLLSLEERFNIQKRLSNLPRNSSKIRVRNRCVLTGRGKGIYSKFMLSRICIRLLIANNQIPGVRKSSWFFNMVQTHLISDCITKIRNAQLVLHHSVTLSYSKLIYNVLQILLGEGYIKSIHNIKTNKKNYIRVILNYDRKHNPMINKICTVSKPGQRIYKKCKKINVTRNNFGIQILSTSKGVISNFEAKKLGIGGEVICKVI